MIRKILFDQTVLPWLERGLDAMALRQKAIADNLANSQTPGYRRKVVDFEEKLTAAVKQAHRERLYRTDPDHLPGIAQPLRLNRPQMRPAEERSDGPGSEELLVEREMSALAQTQLQFEAEVKLTHTQFEMLKMAIRGMR